MKQTIKSIAVLGIIAFVCVAILSVANTFLKTEVTLDQATCSILNSMCATGVDDQTAYNENYFVLLTDDQLQTGANGFSVKSYRVNANKNVQAVYYARKGNSQGSLIVQVKSQGYYDMELLVAFEIKNNDYSIITVAPKQVKEDVNFKQIFNAEYFNLFLDYVKTNKNFTTDEITTVTGATTKNSIRGLCEGVSLAITAMQNLYEYVDEIGAVVDSMYGGGNNE